MYGYNNRSCYGSKDQGYFGWKKGDRNSKFLHAQALNKWRTNRINVLKNSEGTWLKGPQLEAHIVDYFQSIFSTSTDREPMDFLSGIEKRLTRDMKDDLSKPFVDEEVVSTLKQMHPSKAPGPDGLPLVFSNTILAQ